MSFLWDQWYLWFLCSTLQCLQTLQTKCFVTSIHFIPTSCVLLEHSKNHLGYAMPNMMHQASLIVSQLLVFSFVHFLLCHMSQPTFHQSLPQLHKGLFITCHGSVEGYQYVLGCCCDVPGVVGEVDLDLMLSHPQMTAQAPDSVPGAQMFGHIHNVQKCQCRLK